MAYVLLLHAVAAWFCSRGLQEFSGLGLGRGAGNLKIRHFTTHSINGIISDLIRHTHAINTPLAVEFTSGCILELVYTLK